MNLIQLFTPRPVKKYSSRFNPQIELIMFGNHLRLDMGGLTQSGKIIEDIFHSGFKKFLPKSFVPSRVLILGFGAGSAARLINRLWPNAHITGIEIDPAVVKIAKEDFQVEKIPNLKLINADAEKFVDDLITHYDLVLVDCYLGDQIPKKLQSLEFFKKLKQVSTHIIINRLFWGKYQEPTLKFLDALDREFTTKTCRTPSNFLISLQEPSTAA